MTTYADGVFQYGGMPTGGASVPQTFGTYYFVDPNVASGSGDGLTKATAFKYAGEANSAITTNNHDVVMFNANSAVNTAASNDEMALTKNRSHWVGLGGGSRYLGQRTRWTMGVTTGTAIAVVQNTGVGNTFTNIKFDSSDTLSTSLYAFADGGEYTQLTNCEIVKSTDLDQTTSAYLLCNGDSSYYKNCAIGSLVHSRTAATANVLLARETITGKVCRDVIFEDCLLLANSTSNTFGHVRATGATDVERMLLFKNCLFNHAVLGSATVALVFTYSAAQTQGITIVQGGGQVNHTALAKTSDNVHFLGAPIATAATAGDSVAVTN